MERLLVFAVVGFVAQLVDGALGMGYGATSASLLLGAGVAPLASSASIHFAELGATLVSGAAHWREGNVDWRLVRGVAGPGAVAAFLGAVVLTSLDGDALAPFIAGFLFLLGGSVLVRFALGRIRTGRPQPSRRYLGCLGFVAGFLDSIGGGGWGPIATPTLLAQGANDPRTVVGSVSAAEFVITAAAAVGFVGALLAGHVELGMVGALMAGGVVAAPIAARLVRILPARTLGVLVGGMILLTNVRTGGHAVGIGAAGLAVAYATVLVVTAASLWKVREREVEAGPVAVEA
jgi:uncharacterized membrane protein YfcA